MPGLGTTYGRGGATTAPSDLVNSDVILIMGSNMAGNHPVGFQWVIEAKEHHGAHLIHVDPRFSRTSAVANTWVPLRAGSDILFLGGLINHILQNELDFREYVVHYTNASVIIPESFKDTEELGGTFSGWDPEKKQYDTTSWLYQGVQNASHSSDQQPNEMSGGHSMHGVDSSTDLSIYEQDLTLQHPRCVYQIMKRHFARYTPEMVERYCGVAKEAFLNVANLYCGASGPEKTAAICYALGWTQHSSGVQMIRCAAILQLLLGNMGRPGGGILALRGHASIQGSTDIPTLFDSLPGYLSMPKFGPSSKDLASFIKANKPRTGFWNNFDKYIVSQLRAFYGDAATKENDFGFNWLHRRHCDSCVARKPPPPFRPLSHLRPRRFRRNSGTLRFSRPRRADPGIRYHHHRNPHRRHPRIAPRPRARTAPRRKIWLDHAHRRRARRPHRITHSHPLARLAQRPPRCGDMLPGRFCLQPLRMDMGWTRVGARSLGVV